MPDDSLPQIISRSEAKAAGLKRYFTGKACKRNHISERSVANLTCLACQRHVPPLNKPTLISSIYKVQEKGLSRKDYDDSPRGRSLKRAAGKRYYYSPQGSASRERRRKKPRSDAARAALRRYKRTDKGKISGVIHNNLRRARKLTQIGEFTTDDYKRLLSTQKKCHICRKPFTKSDPATQDHIIALADGGMHDRTNIALAHLSCNIRKNRTRTHLI